uniref:Uncharacterized protein n=1 Tax=Setaria italica TaxID=4555 RepID=K3ZCR4_SETIT
MASCQLSLALLLAVLAAAAASPATARGGVPACGRLHLGADVGAWYEAGFTQLEPIHVEVTPHADPAHGGRLEATSAPMTARGHPARGPGTRWPAEGHCPTVGCGAGHGRCSRKDEASRDCRNVDELKIIYYKHWNIWRPMRVLPFQQSNANK